MVHHRKYLESTIREAHTQGLIHAPDPVAKAEMVFAYYEGLLTHARIQNDLSVLSEMEEGTMSLLGVKETASA
jgi:TetR/AcrR family transcriptional repressor of nem operon